MTAPESDQENQMAAIVFSITTAHNLQGQYCDELNRLVREGRTWVKIWEELGIEEDVPGTPSQETKNHILKYMAYGHKESPKFPRAPGFDGCVPLEDLERREGMINAVYRDIQEAAGTGFLAQTDEEREQHGIEGIIASDHFPETQTEMAYIEQLLDVPNNKTPQGYIDIEAITAAVNIDLFNGKPVRKPRAIERFISEIRNARRSDDPDISDESIRED